MNKIDKISNLKFDDFKTLISNLITKIGYNNLVIENEVIIAKSSSPLTQDSHGFILFQDRLSGIEDESKYVKVIEEVKNRYNFHTTFIVSKETISHGFEDKIQKSISNINIEFLDRDKIIDLIDNYNIDYWKHDDIELIDYEKEFCSLINQDNEIKKLKIFNDKYQKLLDIFIEPAIFHLYEDRETKTPIRKKVSISYISEDVKPSLISGDAGTGKTTLLKKIAQDLIEKNRNRDKKYLPVFLNVLELFENNFDVKSLVINKLNPHFEFNDDLSKLYDIVIFIDTIDEFEKENQHSIIADLEKLRDKFSLRYIIGTRNIERILINEELKGANTYHIEKFNTEQVRQFVAKFFHGESSRAENLLEALKENRIYEKLPVTPLTISLISILYEENDLEIPATITDIYDNFNSLLLGKAIVSSRLELIDVSFRERILSLYGLELLTRSQHNPMTQDEFIAFFQNYFTSKTLPIKKGSLEDLLNYLINHTGILTLKNNKFVQFSHDSFMEYYAAIEIFKHRRDFEKDLVSNFFNHNWQNSAIFYAGKSKDLPGFLNEIILKLKSAGHIQDFFSGVMGTGYILQALYQTDNQIRKEAILEALNLNIQAHEVFMKLSSDNNVLFKNYKLPILWLMNMFYFYENFNSITLKDALQLSFDELNELYKNSKGDTTLGYKTLKVGMTMNSNRINVTQPLEELIDNSQILKDPILTLLLDFSLDIFQGNNYKELKKEVRKEFKKLREPIKQLTELPASRLRFGLMDKIKSSKKVKIITEGKTDAEILEHAYMTLTKGSVPYWQINTAGNSDSGGAHDLSKTLMGVKPTLNENEIVIGIFDHDDKGLQEFRGLKPFVQIKNDTIKKHSSANIFSICLPVSANREGYLKKEQAYNLLAIEHYFSDDFLRKHDAVTESPITDDQGNKLLKIKDSKKKALSKAIRELTDPLEFESFISLFKEIDAISGVEIEYQITL